LDVVWMWFGCGLDVVWVVKFMVVYKS
jgi:hypothetical protein